MAAPKGHPKWGGRPKGRANKTTRDLKLMIETALDSTTIGDGVEYLRWAAVTQPGPFLMLVGRLLPRDVKIEIVHDIAERLIAARKRALEVIEPPAQIEASNGVDHEHSTLDGSADRR